MSKRVIAFVFSVVAYVAAQVGAIVEMTGNAPKMIWGKLEAPICEMILDRENARLNSTCDIHTAENAELKIEVDELKTEVSELKTWKTTMEAQMEHVFKTIAWITPPPSVPPSSPPLPPPPPSNIYVMGGYSSSSSSYRSSVLKYDVNANAWTTVASLSAVRSWFENAAAALGGYIYVVGGRKTGSIALASAERYDPTSDTWSAIASMSTARFGLGVATDDHAIYAFGGFAFSEFSYDFYNFYNLTERFDPHSNTWSVVASMSTARVYPGAVSLDGYIYAIGGHNDNPSFLSSAERYNPASDTWSPIASMITARTSLGAAALGNNIYVVGGRTRGNPDSDVASAERYDPSSDTWSVITPMSRTRRHPSFAALGGHLYVIGGHSLSAGTSIASVKKYDPSSNTWTAVAPLPTDVMGASVAVL